jgi:hypothetical protein
MGTTKWARPKWAQPGPASDSKFGPRDLRPKVQVQGSRFRPWPRLKSLLKNAWRAVAAQEHRPSAAKAVLISLTLSARVNSCPFKTAMLSAFSASCKGARQSRLRKKRRRAHGAAMTPCASLMQRWGREFKGGDRFAALTTGARPFLKRLPEQPAGKLLGTPAIPPFPCFARDPKARRAGFDEETAAGVVHARGESAPEQIFGLRQPGDCRREGRRCAHTPGLRLRLWHCRPFARMPFRPGTEARPWTLAFSGGVCRRAGRCCAVASRARKCRNVSC